MRLDEVTLGLIVVAVYGFALGIIGYDGWLVLSQRTRKYWESRAIGQSFTLLLQFILFVAYILAILFALTMLFKFFGAVTSEIWRTYGRVWLIALNVGIGCRTVFGYMKK